MKRGNIGQKTGPVKDAEERKPIRRLFVAVTDTVFPSLDPTQEILAGVGTLSSLMRRMKCSASGCPANISTRNLREPDRMKPPQSTRVSTMIGYWLKRHTPGSGLPPGMSIRGVSFSILAMGANVARIAW